MFDVYGPARRATVKTGQNGYAGTFGQKPWPKQCNVPMIFKRFKQKKKCRFENVFFSMRAVSKSPKNVGAVTAAAAGPSHAQEMVENMVSPLLHFLHMLFLCC